MQLLSDPKLDWNGFCERTGRPGHTPVPSLPRGYEPVVLAEVARRETALLPMRGNSAHEQRFLKSIIALSAIFPIQDMGEDGFALRQGLLNHLFADYPITLVEEACQDFARTGEWFPRPKELIERIERFAAREHMQIKRLKELQSKIA